MGMGLTLGIRGSGLEVPEERHYKFPQGGDGGGVVDRHAQVRAALDAPRVVAAQRAQLVDHPPIVRGGRIPGGWAGDKKVDVLQQEPRAIVGSDLACGPARQEVSSLRDEPGVPQDAAADEHARDRRRAQAIQDLRRLDEITRPEDRDPDSLRHAGDERPVGQAAIGLVGGPAVHGDSRRASFLNTFRQVRRVHVALAPPGAHLDGHRDLHRLRDGGNDGRRAVRLAHQAAARGVPRDLRDGTSHVDVDNVRAA